MLLQEVIPKSKSAGDAAFGVFKLREDLEGCLPYVILPHYPYTLIGGPAHFDNSLQALALSGVVWRWVNVWR